MTPYMSFLLQPFIDTLGQYTAASLEDELFWICVIETLSKSFACDDGGRGISIPRPSFLYLPLYPVCLFKPSGEMTGSGR